MLTIQVAHLAARVTEFWDCVQRGTPEQCWPWQAYQEDGYGKFYFEGRMRGAHELARTFATGEVRAKDLDTCHSCHNPICCNPHHLRFASRASNVQDMDEAGRRKLGPTKLTLEVAREIRTRIAHGALQRDLAEEYGVTNGMISMIKTHRRYPDGGGNDSDPGR